MSDDSPQTHRLIRSFVMRAGRMTEGQQRGWDQGWERFGVAAEDGPFDWEAAFPGLTGPRIIEIGYGMGDSLVAMAEAEPNHRFVGIEVHRPGVGRLLSQVIDRNVHNLRTYAEDAVPIIENAMAPDSLDGIQIYFPDPWHKKRHHKRRLIQPAFVELLASRLRGGGSLHLATDWQPYAEHMMAVLSDCPLLANSAGVGQFVPRPERRPETKFERRGARLGHGVWDLLFIRQ
jgi:tRNA (guanine-N7-)-methyltransferase